MAIDAGHEEDKRARFIFMNAYFLDEPAAQRARRHSSRFVLIYAIANCYHQSNFESRAFTSDECETELQFRN